MAGLLSIVFYLTMFFYVCDRTFIEDQKLKAKVLSEKKAKKMAGLSRAAEKALPHQARGMK